MSYNIGDKFIIEIDRIYSSKKHDVSRYGIKGFSCLIFDYTGLKKLQKLERPADTEEAYMNGYNDGWDDASKGKPFDEDCMTEYLALEFLNNSGWLQEHDKAIHEAAYRQGEEDGQKLGNQEVVYEKGIDNTWAAVREIVCAYKVCTFEEGALLLADMESHIGGMVEKYGLEAVKAWIKDEELKGPRVTAP